MNILIFGGLGKIGAAPACDLAKVFDVGVVGLFG
jgi:hypothetical protein